MRKKYLSDANRLRNASNRLQGHFKRVLCVCSASVARSPTLAELLSRDPFNFNTRAVGVDDNSAVIPIDIVHIKWADEICVMEEYHRLHVQDMLTQLDDGWVRPIHVFNVPDIYGFRHPQLIQILMEKCYEIFQQ